MPTMSLYELKVSGLVKAGDPDPGEVFTKFEEIMDYGTSWGQLFGQVNEPPLPLKTDTPPILESWLVPNGSKLAENSKIVKDSLLNGQKLTSDTTVPAGGVAVTGKTLLLPGAIVARGSTLVRDPLKQTAWEVRMEESPQWGLDTSGNPVIIGTYHALSLHGIMSVTRPGALGQHWDNQSGPDDLWWFYKYKTLPWFKALMAVLIDFNSKFAVRLAEPARVRDLKWYCGNGAGP